jgi:hypothetical protein
MPHRTRISPKFRQGDLWLAPLPHPSWSGEAVLDRAQPVVPAEFWQRLGL